MFGETTIFYVKVWNHPTETTIYKQMFQVPGCTYHNLSPHESMWGFIPPRRLYETKWSHYQTGRMPQLPYLGTHGNTPSSSHDLPKIFYRNRGCAGMRKKLGEKLDPSSSFTGIHSFLNTDPSRCKKVMIIFYPQKDTPKKGLQSRYQRGPPNSWGNVIFCCSFVIDDIRSCWIHADDNKV